MEALPHSPTDVAHAVVRVPAAEALALMPRRDPAATHELVTRDAEPAGLLVKRCVSCSNRRGCNQSHLVQEPSRPRLLAGAAELP